MEVDVRVEVLSVKVVEPRSPLVVDMVIAKMLKYDIAILGLCQGVFFCVVET